MQSPKEFQGEIRRPSLINSAKEQRKTTEWQRLDISPRKFHVRMCTTNDRNSKDLTEAEEIKKSWQEYTEKHKRS